ncbi:MAG TPA: HEAT repeat domain-containing protein [Polyangiaceae bacterium]|nr:HEAT repeat domain-containing protein [Polyangiaceae bacterium]
MGFFDLFSKKTPAEPKAAAADAKAPAKPKAKDANPRELARLARVVSNKMSQNYDRQEAIDQLSAMANVESARALLKRFDFSMEPSITDQDEKEAAARGIAAAGMDALEPIHAYCARAESLTWPLKVLRQIVPADQIVTELLTLLDQFDTEYMRNPEPKIQLVTLLGEYRTEEVREAIEPFLGDVNESVRFHASGTLFSIGNPESAQPLVAVLAEEESLRVKNRIARGLEQSGWVLPEALATLASAGLPPNYVVKDGKVVPGT